MTLSFSQKWPAKMGKWAGQPTYFREKIWAGLPIPIYGEIIERYRLDVNGILQFKTPVGNPKIGTIRKGNRWKVGDKIHMVINNRTKDRFQFAPVLEVKSVQDIEIIWMDLRWGDVKVYIDGDLFYSSYTNDHPNDLISQLATNDGFESVEQFFTWFNEPFEGQIISWVEGAKY